MEATKRKKTKALLDPRQAAFLSSYLDPKSQYYGNALQSALKAGYKQEYAENITTRLPNWLAEKVGTSKHQKMLVRAEQNLDDFLNLEPLQENTRKDGQKYTKFNNEVLKVKADVTKFVAERLGKIHYATKGEPLEAGTTNNFVQIVVNPPHGPETGNKSDA